jgi:hypothetical protein
VFEAIPRLADMAIADLVRTWGNRSVFAVAAQGADAGSTALARRLVSDGRRAYACEILADGSTIALDPGAGGFDGTVRVTLLDRDLVPEATVEYAGFGEDGVPREIHLVDLRDAHTLDVEVEDVALAPAEAPGGGTR